MGGRGGGGGGGGVGGGTSIVHLHRIVPLYTAETLRTCPVIEPTHASLVFLFFSLTFWSVPFGFFLPLFSFYQTMLKRSRFTIQDFFIVVFLT